MLRWIRAIFILYMAGLLLWFVPSHVRGQMSFEQRQATGEVAPSCCAIPAETTEDPQKPSQSDRENCVVCHWAAGVLPTAYFAFTIEFVELTIDTPADPVHVFCSADFFFDGLPRGPPVPLV
jgi:hypothetical protein